MAVVGIVLLYKPIYDLYVTSHSIPDKIWSIVAVSIAAQVITFPLSLYYFHQFPNYFMITNILVVPLSTLIIYVGIILLFFGSVPYMSYILAKSLACLVWLLNSSIHFIEELPFSITRGIFITGVETIGLYFLIIVFFLYWVYKKKRYFFALVLCLLYLFTCFFVKELNNIKSNRIIVYGSKQFPAYDFISERESILMLYMKDQRRSEDPFFIENLHQTWSAMGINRHLNILLIPDQIANRNFKYGGRFFKRGNFIQFRGKRIGIIGKCISVNSDCKIHLDYLIISGNPKLSVDQLNKLFSPDEIIIDPSNSIAKARVWLAQASKLKITCRWVNEEGSVILDF